MKTLFKISTIVLCLILINNIANAQKKSKKEFKGSITYKVSYPDNNLDVNTLMQLPAMQIVKIKGCKSKLEETSGPVTQISITDASTKTVIVLIDYIGSKYVLKQNEKEINENLIKLPAVTISFVDETKTIAGYECKKAIITTTDNGNIISDTAYYTEDIGCKDFNFSSPYKDIPGVLLEYSMQVEQIGTIKYTATIVKKEKISDTEFIVPKDYKEVTLEELKKAFGG